VKSSVLCVGSIVHDTRVRPVGEMEWGTATLVDTIETHIGGNGALSAIALAKSGIPVRLFGAVGRDERAPFLLDTLRGAGVDTGGVEIVDGPSAATIVLVNAAGERKLIHRMGASAVAFPQPLEFTRERCEGAAWFHLASQFVMPNVRLHGAEMLRRARAAGLHTSLDTNWDSSGRWMEDLRPCLAHTDVAFMNEDEARMITGSADGTGAARVLMRHGVRTAVIKLGARGCAIHTAGDFRCPAFEVEARDTTGAGDVFVGAFIAALLRGAELPEAGRFANAVAALGVQSVGGAGRIPPLAEMETWMRTARLRS
jgi:sugar/nucleoside kinase (ribokinase family)